MNKPIVFSVPSGNFGNLTAGLLASRMGLPAQHFIAATNANDVVPKYLASGEYRPRPSVRTLSNAMDVGAPSNFARMMDLYGSTWNMIKNDISGFAFSDAETEKTLREVDQQYHYLLDPHGAIGYLALRQYQATTKKESMGIILETAHPAKFREDMERILHRTIDIPERLAELQHRPKVSTILPADFDTFRSYLMEENT